MTLVAERPGSGAAEDGRPAVAIRQRSTSPWLFVGMAAIAALLLFMALDARRRALTQAAPSPDGQTISRAPEQVPDLILPQPYEADDAAQGNPTWPMSWRVQPGTGAATTSQMPAPVSTRPARPAEAFAQPIPSPAFAPPYANSPMIVSEPSSTALPLRPSASSQGIAGTSASPARRITASRLENPATTVPQGTLISAVLESALDSTGAGQTRALVTRNVHGFDGSQVLIPRGTRLYGTYQSDVEQGQKRAKVRWTRLIRPDGVTLDLDSPAADPLGRAGIRGKVNNHFLQRFGNALLSSTVGLGSALVGQRASPVVVAVPAGNQSAQLIPQNDQRIAPTLTVRQGTRVSVFVQHDLDFSLTGTTP